MMQYVVIFERATSKAQVVGPFADEVQAEAYAKLHHRFPQVWRIGEFSAPLTEAKPAE